HSQDCREWERRGPPAPRIQGNRRFDESGGLHHSRDGIVGVLNGGSGRLIARAFDPEFSPGAYNAVHVCLRIQSEEKVTLITDWACLEIAASIAAELDKLGSPYQTFVLEELAERPLIDM